MQAREEKRMQPKHSPRVDCFTCFLPLEAASYRLILARPLAHAVVAPGLAWGGSRDFLCPVMPHIHLSTVESGGQRKEARALKAQAVGGSVAPGQRHFGSFLTPDGPAR